MKKLFNFTLLGKLSTLAIVGLLAMSQKDICDEARLHPLLPTLKQIEANGNDVYAYHLPQKTTIKVGYENITIVSWNVDPASENPARDIRVYQALTRIITEQKADIILLQDQIMDEFAEFNGKWNSLSLITGATTILYNSDKFTRLQDEACVSGYYSRLKINTSGKVIGLHNLSNGSDDFLNSVADEEDRILERLNLGLDKADVSVVGGSFKHSYVPSNKRYLPNSVSYTGDVQTASWKDGFFYMASDGVPHQPSMETIDPATGEIFIDLESAPDDLDKKQISSLNILEPTLNILALADRDKQSIKDFFRFSTYTLTSNAFGDRNYQLHGVNIEDSDEAHLAALNDIWSFFVKSDGDALKVGLAYLDKIKISSALKAPEVNFSLRLVLNEIIKTDLQRVKSIEDKEIKERALRAFFLKGAASAFPKKPIIDAIKGYCNNLKTIPNTQIIIANLLSHLPEVRD